MKYEVWVAYWLRDKHIEQGVKFFDTEEEAKDWIWIKERIHKVKGEVRVYWIEECF